MLGCIAIVFVFIANTTLLTFRLALPRGVDGSTANGTLYVSFCTEAQMTVRYLRLLIDVPLAAVVND